MTAGSGSKLSFWLMSDDYVIETCRMSGQWNKLSRVYYIGQFRKDLLLVNLRDAGFMYQILSSFDGVPRADVWAIKYMITCKQNTSFSSEIFNKPYVKHANRNHDISIAHKLKNLLEFWNEQVICLCYHEYPYAQNISMRFLRKTPLAWLVDREWLNQSKAILTIVLYRYASGVFFWYLSW